MLQVASLLLLASPQILVQNQILPQWSSQLPPWFGGASLFTFNQFNPRLGTLDEIRITSRLICEDYSVQFESLCASAGPVTTSLPYTSVYMTSRWTVNGNTIFSSPITYSGSIFGADPISVNGPFDGIEDYSGPSGVTTHLDTIPIEQGWGTISPSILAPAIGSGTLNLLTTCYYPYSTPIQNNPCAESYRVDTTVTTKFDITLAYVYH